MMKKKNVFLVKFAIVAAMIGFFSPSVNVNPGFQAKNGYSAIPLQLSISLLNTVEARGGRGGGARGARGGGSRARAGNVNRGGGANRNRNTNRNVNRNVNVNHYYGGGGRYGYWGGRAIVAWSSALIIGSMVAAASMPTTCTTFVHGGVSYRQCGSSYYQPFYEGDTVVYKVVSSPY